MTLNHSDVSSNLTESTKSIAAVENRYHILPVSYAGDRKFNSSRRNQIRLSVLDVKENIDVNGYQRE